MQTFRPTFGAFNQGYVPAIACFNNATVPLGIDFDALITAMQVFVDDHVAPVWGTPAKLVKSTGFIPDHWAMVRPRTKQVDCGVDEHFDELVRRRHADQVVIVERRSAGSS